MSSQKSTTSDDHRPNEEIPLPSNLNYRMLVEKIKDTIWYADLNLNFTYISPAATEIIGFSQAEAMSHSIAEMLTPASAQHACEFLSGLLNKAIHNPTILDQPHTLEIEFVCKDGGTIWTEVRIAFICNDNGVPVGVLGVTHDISARKQAEESLQRSEGRYRRLVETTDDWVWEVDADAIYTYASPKVKELIGYEPEEIIGVSVFDLMPPDEVDRVRSEFCEKALRGEPLVAMENTMLHKDGSRVIIETTGVPLFDSEGKLTGYQGCDRDITARKIAERDLKNYSAALEDANRTLRELYTAAEAATRAKSEFLANMSHEIRTPMTAILGYAELLLENMKRPEDIEATMTIKRNGDHLLQLINDILDLTKIEAGKMEIEPCDCLPAAIVADVVSLMRVRTEAKKLALDIQLSGPIPETIRTDPLRLRQILINLLGNAIKFTELGSIRLTVWMETDDDGSHRMRFDVTDTGIGMAENQIDSLFQPFTQCDASTSRKFGGTGLGLAISKRLAEMLGGGIEVKSTPDLGSTFSATVATGPLQNVRMIDKVDKAASPTYDSPEKKKPPKILGCRLLLVEDGPDNQRLISFVLKRAGAEVVLAENGQEALDIVQGAQPHGNPFDLILMDMQMPILDGYEATRRLRTEGFNNPIIALTAHAMSGDREKCIEAGCNDYLSKPIDRPALIETVTRHLNPVECTASG